MSGSISTTPGAGSGGGRIGGGGGGGAGGGGGGAGGGGGGGGTGGPCGACKFLRRKCVSGCIFAPYFDSEQGAAHFAAVHKVFGASNVSKLLLHIPAHKRLDAVVTICYEAQARLRDPVYGCVAHIFALQQQVVNLQAELSYLQAHLATMELPSPPPPPPPPAPPLTSPPSPFSISDLPSSSSLSTLPSTVDLSTLFDPPAAQPPPSWSLRHHQHQPPPPPQQLTSSELRQQPCTTAITTPTNPSDNPGCGGGGDLQALARALLDRHRSAAGEAAPPVDLKVTKHNL